MSPVVYTALQIITRGRDTGVTVVELGRQSGYDQKTCFYLVRQLTELDLVYVSYAFYYHLLTSVCSVKVRRGGVGTHFCIHKYFFSRSLSWKAIRDEEIEAEALNQSKSMGEPDLIENEDVQGSQSLTFTPIDARHLSSLPLISARVVRLLKASKNHIHASNNMLITLVRYSSFSLISNLTGFSGIFKSNEDRPSIFSEPDPRDDSATYN